MTAIKLRLRLHAAGWVALAGAVCCAVFAFAYLRHLSDSPLFMLGLSLAAALAAGISGFLVGWHLFAPDEHHEADDAIGLGLGTVTLAYPLLFTVLAVAAYIWNRVSPVNGWDWEAAPIARYMSTLSSDPLLSIIVLSWIAMMYTSWITLPMGGVAGYFVSRRYRKGPATNPSARVRRWCGFSGILFFVLPWLFCVAPFGANELVNNVRLHLFASPLFDYPLPPNTEVISRSQVVGLLGGNGNHCDFEATQYMRTTLAQEQIEKYYSEVRLPRVLTLWEPKRAGDSDIFLFFDGVSDGSLLFHASLGDIGYSAGFDWRCN